MQLSAANDNTPQSRPQWFDTLLLKYMPFIESHCRGAAEQLDAEEYTQETIRYMLSYWHRYSREKKFTSFVALMAREVRRDLLRKSAVVLDMHVMQTVDPAQEHAVDVGLALAALRGDKRQLAGLVAAGYTNREIGVRFGVSESAIERRKRDMRCELAANDNRQVRSGKRVVNA